ncbi:MAG TPA: DUF1330 domain-containing protein [Cyclobacteriaceae bacterium]
MIYITQLIHVKEGKEDVFNEFESLVIPLIARYNGTLVLRLRPEAAGVVSSSIDVPYEIHLVKFDNEQGFEAFMNDGERKKFIHLKEQSIRSVILIKGQIVAPVTSRPSIL